MGYAYILGTIIFAVYGQIIIKWKMSGFGQLPIDILDKALFLLRILMNPFILSGFLSAFISSIFWMAAMTKFEISFAYPFMSVSYVLIFLLSILIFNETITSHKIIGSLFIILGIIITSRSA